MTIERALVEFLRGQAAVTALVGRRVFEDLIPANESLPAVEVSLAQSDDVNALDGQADTATSRLAIDCFAAEPATARAALAAVAAAVRVFETQWSGLAVQSSVPVSRSSGKSDNQWLDGHAYVRRLVIEVFHAI